MSDLQMLTRPSALNIESGEELERYVPEVFEYKGETLCKYTGFEGVEGKCWWCGNELQGRQRKYCKGHGDEYYKHFDWGLASRWALGRANGCENCGKGRHLMRNGNRNLEVHHIVPLKGGYRSMSAHNLPWNLIVLCHKCHLAIHEAMKVRMPNNQTQENQLRLL